MAVMSTADLPADNRLALRRVMRAARKAALATLLDGGGGAPYVSLVTVALDHDLSPILLLSGLSDHTRNLGGDARLSLLFDGTEGHANPQTGPRVTIQGTARPDPDARLAARFLAHHPAAAQYAGFGDFAFWRVAIERAHFVGGFARAVWFKAPLGLPTEAVVAMAGAEDAILSHMNEHHFEAVDRMAHRLLGLAGTGWRLAGIDPDGCDLVLSECFARLAFDTVVDGPEAARRMLMDLAH
jgi:putative heme iron utilization protein